MEHELEKQQQTREVLEDLARGTDISDTILVPLMQQHDFDVNKCVDVLLDIINDPLPSADVSSEEERLQEERRLLEQYKREAELKEKVRLAHAEKAKAKAEEEARELAKKAEEQKSQELQARIAAELERKREREEELKKLREQEEIQAAKRREVMEREWEASMAKRQAELDEKKKLIEEQRAKVLNQQLQLLKANKSQDFRNQVEEALKKKMEEQTKADQATKAAAEQRKPDAISVSDIVDVDLTCSREAEPGTRMTVYWEYKAGKPSKSDWIGYYKKSRADDSNGYYTYQRTGGTEKGSLEIVVPAKLGICEFRFFQNNSYKLVSRSTPIRVGKSVQVKADLVNGNIVASVKYSDPKEASSWDWLGLYQVDERNNKLYYEGMSAYVTKDQIPFKAPRKPGRYELRFFQSGSGYSELAVSNPVDIDDLDMMKASPQQVMANDTLDVVWRIESIDCHKKDWVGIFKRGEFNPMTALAPQNTHTSKGQGSLKFLVSPLWEAGEYEFVFVDYRSNTCIKRSNPFTVVVPQEM